LLLSQKQKGRNKFEFKINFSDHRCRGERFLFDGDISNRTIDGIHQKLGYQGDPQLTYIEARWRRGRRGAGFKKCGHKNPIKHEKGGPLDFLTTRRTPLKKIWPKPQGQPPGFPTLLNNKTFS
jgi:hypothetical protein